MKALLNELVQAKAQGHLCDVIFSDQGFTCLMHPDGNCRVDLRRVEIVLCHSPQSTIYKYSDCYGNPAGTHIHFWDED